MENGNFFCFLEESTPIYYCQSIHNLPILFSICICTHKSHNLKGVLLFSRAFTAFLWSTLSTAIAPLEHIQNRTVYFQSLTNRTLYLPLRICSLNLTNYIISHFIDNVNCFFKFFIGKVSDHILSIPISNPLKNINQTIFGV